MLDVVYKSLEWTNNLNVTQNKSNINKKVYLWLLTVLEEPRSQFDPTDKGLYGVPSPSESDPGFLR